MKHIKIFESHNVYYKQIDEDEYNLSISGTSGGYNNEDESDMARNFTKANWLNFTEEELDDIKNILFGYKYTIYESGAIDIVRNQYKANMKYFYMAKLIDEWYYLSYFGINADNKKEDSLLFKCDQFEGLLKCITSLS